MNPLAFVFSILTLIKATLPLSRELVHHANEFMVNLKKLKRKDGILQGKLAFNRVIIVQKSLSFFSLLYFYLNTKLIIKIVIKMYLL